MKLKGNTGAQNTPLSVRSRFLRRTSTVAVAAALVAIAGLSLSGTLVASNDDGTRGCTLATLKGRYLFAISGTLFPPVLRVTQPTPFNAAGFNLFNGDGTGTEPLTLTVGGEIAVQQSVQPFVYTVNPDCTGSYTAVNGASFDLFIAPDGEQFAIVATAPPGFGGSGINRRVSRK